MDFPKTVTELKDVVVAGEKKSAAEMLRNPGEFCYAKRTDQWANGAVIMRCPQCNQSCAFPLKNGSGVKKFFLTVYYKLINFQGELLTMEPGLVCSYCRLKFKVKFGQIEILE